jgi:hypothetical protein
MHGLAFPVGDECLFRVDVTYFPLEGASSVVFRPARALGDRARSFKDTSMNLHLPSLFAYIDPGTGSMLLQLLLAGVLTVGHLAGIRLGRIKAYVLGLVKQDG